MTSSINHTHFRVYYPNTDTDNFVGWTDTDTDNDISVHLYDAHYTTLTVVACCREDGDQDGEVGELEGSNNSSGLLSHSTMGTGKLESPLPPQSRLDLDKQGKTSIWCGGSNSGNLPL